MKTFFQANDGKLFESKTECEVHEIMLSKKGRFDKSRFYTDYGSECEKYSALRTPIIYIDPEEREIMTAYLKTQNRTIEGENDSHIYMSYNMTFYPIEKQIEREEEKARKIQATVKRLEELKEKIMKKTRNK